MIRIFTVLGKTNLFALLLKPVAYSHYLNKCELEIKIVFIVTPSPRKGA